MVSINDRRKHDTHDVFISCVWPSSVFVYKQRVNGVEKVEKNELDEIPVLHRGRF